MKTGIRVISILFLLLSAQAVFAQRPDMDTSMVVINPSDPLISYTGRIDFRSKNAPVFSYPGVSVKFQFTGDAIDMLMQDMAEGDEAHTNYLTVILDNDKPFVVKLSKKQKIYFLARSLDLREHTIEIIKRTESSVGSVMLHGFRLRQGHRLQPMKEPLPEKKIEFIGNSLTTGYGNEASIEAPPKGNPGTGFHSANENNYTAWGAVACRMLKTQYMCTAYSGRGLYRNNTGSTTGTMPLVYDYVTPDKADVLWTYQRFVPDVIVIDLGTNDFAQGVPDSAAFCSTYVSFLEKLRGIHSNAKIICVAGNALTDSWPAGEKRWTRMKSYLNSVVKNVNAKGDAYVYYFELTPQTGPYGEDWHPSNATHKKMAEAIVPYIKTVTGW